ncbi:MAG: DNA recombination protein RmuC [Patescibacteria group bacterium]
MELTTILIVLIFALLLIVVFLLSKKQKPSGELMEVIKMLQMGSKEDRRVLMENLSQNTQFLNERLDNAAKIMGEVQRNLGEMSEVGRGIKTLQEFLQSPKLRGGLGEQVLKDMIGQTFPKNAFHLQYAFKSGVKVDAVLKTEAGMLCIDSKFPMENFNLMIKGETEIDRARAKREFISDVKKHVSDISQKYILPEEGTMDFALMYIPSETVYYEIANTQEITDFARRLRVYPVSPNTLYAHLQVLLLSFEGKELESKSKEVFKLLRAIQKDYSKVEENLNTLQKHLNNAFNMMSTVYTSFTQLGQKVSSSNSLTSGLVDKEKIEI